MVDKKMVDKMEGKIEGEGIEEKEKGDNKGIKDDLQGPGPRRRPTPIDVAECSSRRSDDDRFVLGFSSRDATVYTVDDMVDDTMDSMMERRYRGARGPANCL